MSPEPTPRRAIRIVSQCATKDDFIAVFHPYLERDAMFVATASPEEAGARLRFVMTLAGGEAVLRGAGVVVESHRSKSNFYGLRGMKLRFDELDLASRTALRAVEAGPRRHSSQPAGRGPNEMVECLIYEDPGSESREPLGDATSSEQSDPGNLPPITADDDVTAVAPLPRRLDDEDADKRGDTTRTRAASADGQPSDDPRSRLPGFVVPRPQSDPALHINPGGQQVAIAEVDTQQLPELERAKAEPIPQPPRLPTPDDSSRARRGKPTGGGAVAELPPHPVPGDGNPPGDIAALATMRLPASEIRRGVAVPERFRHDSSPPDFPEGFIPPAVRQPGAPLRPLVPAATITPTEIVSPMALEARTERRRSRSPMASERTDVVRVSYVRTAAVSATLGALLGLGAGYLLWGSDHEQQGVTEPDDSAVSAEVDPDPVAPQEPAASKVIDAGPPAAKPDAAPARPRTPRPKPAPRRRRR